MNETTTNRQIVCKARATGEAGLGYTEGVGAPFVGVMFKILDGELSGQVHEFRGNLGTPDGAEFTIKALRAAGFTGDEFPSPSEPWPGLGSVEVALLIEREPSQADPTKLYWKIRFVNVERRLKIAKPMQADRVAAISRQCARIFRETAGKAPASVPPPARTNGANVPPPNAGDAWEPSGGDSAIP